jgi:hypothetical protein
MEFEQPPHFTGNTAQMTDLLLFQGATFEGLSSGARRRALAKVEQVGLLLLCVPSDCKPTAAYPARRRCSHAAHQCGYDSRVGGTPPLFENLRGLPRSGVGLGGDNVGADRETWRHQERRTGERGACHQCRKADPPK